MTRKIQPEQTKANIINVSKKLFSEKGYEKTTTQEIVTITGLSKGTIFHHFKSKEEILLAVLDLIVDRMLQEADELLAKMVGLTAREKLTKLFEEPDLTPEDELDTLIFKMGIATQSPHIIVANMKKCHEKMVPMITNLMNEGVEDGSITTDFPDECAQLFILLYTIWTEPLTLECDAVALHNRLKFIQHMMKSLGVDIISDKFIESNMEFAKIFFEEK